MDVGAIYPLKIWQFLLLVRGQACLINATGFELLLKSLLPGQFHQRTVGQSRHQHAGFFRKIRNEAGHFICLSGSGRPLHYNLVTQGQLPPEELSSTVLSRQFNRAPFNKLSVVVHHLADSTVCRLVTYDADKILVVLNWRLLRAENKNALRLKLICQLQRDSFDADKGELRIIRLPKPNAIHLRKLFLIFAPQISPGVISPVLELRHFADKQRRTEVISLPGKTAGIPHLQDGAALLICLHILRDEHLASLH